MSEKELTEIEAKGLLAERDKEWFQIIESILDFHPVSMTEALDKGIEKVKLLRAERDKLKKQMSNRPTDATHNP